MRVMQINCSSNGSTGVLARSIHNALVQAGHESCFMYGMGPDIGAGTYQISNFLDYRFHTYAGRLTGLHGYYSGSCTKKALVKIEEFKPDIVHLHNLHGDYINIGMLFDYIKHTGIRTLLTLHDCWMFTGGCAHFTMAKCERWLNECGRCMQQNVYPKSYVFDTSRKCLRDKKRWLSGLDNLRISAVSEWLAGEAKKSYLNRYEINTIYNGVNINVFKPTRKDISPKYGIQKGKFIVLGVSSLWNDTRKGLKQFVELRNKLSADYQIVLVGLSSDQRKEMPEGIIGITRTEDQTELAALYSIADVFVNVSPEETFGLVTAESLACGTPAIVSTQTACPEIISPATGCAVNTQDADEIAKYVRKICSGIISINAEDCVSRIREYFTNEVMIKNYLDKYCEMMSK